MTSSASAGIIRYPWPLVGSRDYRTSPSRPCCTVHMYLYRCDSYVCGVNYSSGVVAAHQWAYVRNHAALAHEKAPGAKVVRSLQSFQYQHVEIARYLSNTGRPANEDVHREGCYQAHLCFANRTIQNFTSTQRGLVEYFFHASEILLLQLWAFRTIDLPHTSTDLSPTHRSESTGTDAVQTTQLRSRHSIADSTAF